MRTSHYRYPVRLSEEQRRWLETMLPSRSRTIPQMWENYNVSWAFA